MKKRMKMTSAGVALAILLGCDALEVEPGNGFSMEVLTPMPLEMFQAVTPVELVFSVDGCDDFSVSVRSRAGSTQDDSVQDFVGDLTFEAIDERRFRSHVPVAWLAGHFMSSQNCGYGANWPLPNFLDLVVQCSDGRQRAAQIKGYYAAAAKHRHLEFPATKDSYVFSGSDPDNTYVIGGGVLASVRDDQHDTYALTSSPTLGGFAPKVVQSGRMLYAMIGCALPDCGKISIPVAGGDPVEVKAGRVLMFELVDGGLALDSYVGFVNVPENAADMALSPEGTVVVLGRFPTTLTHIETSGEVRHTLFPGEGAAEIFPHFSRLPNGRLAFLTQKEDPYALLLRTDDNAAPTVIDDLPAWSSQSRAYLSADAARWLVHHVDSDRTEHAWLGGIDLPFTKLALDPTPRFLFDITEHKVAWLDDGIAISRILATGGVLDLHFRRQIEVFDISGDASLRYVHHPQPLNDGGVSLAAASITAAGTRLLYTMPSTGENQPHALRILDRSGTFVGGADPLPCNAWISNQGPIVEGDSATVVTNAGLLVFDLSHY